MIGRSRRLVLLIALVAACTSPVPTFTPSAPPATAIALAAYEGDDLSFEYPAEWRVIAERDMRIGQYTYVVVGTGDWQSGTQHSTQVNADAWTVDPGELVAHLSYFYSGPASTVFQTPPFDARVLESGLAATIEDGPRSTLATLFVPGHREITVDVRYGGEPTDLQRSAVHRMIDSMDAMADSDGFNLKTGTPPSGPGCSTTAFQGTLARGDLGGLNLALPDFAWVWVSWPEGWTARVREDRRVELFDRNGAHVAREWDEVDVGGSGDSNEFQSCPDAVSVIRAFPLAPE